MTVGSCTDKLPVLVARKVLARSSGKADVVAAEKRRVVAGGCGRRFHPQRPPCESHKIDNHANYQLNDDDDGANDDDDAVEVLKRVHLPLTPRSRHEQLNRSKSNGIEGIQLN